MKKIVITGISSSILQGLAKRIDLSTYQVIGISRNPTVIEGYEAIQIVKGDLHNIESFSNYLDNSEMLIHGAAITHAKSKTSYERINLKATQDLVQVCNHKGVKKFIFISSNTANRRNGHYANSKILAEEYIQENCNNWMILRLSEVFGSKQNEGIDKLIFDVMNKPFVICPTGVPSKFYPIHVEDTIRLLHEKAFVKNLVNKTVVINGRVGYTFLEFINEVKTISAKTPRVIFVNKQFMFLVKKIAQISPISFGIVPDQIDRLYGEKHVEENQYELLSLESYINKLLKNS